ncbi:phospholipase [Flavobacterium faecale]|uniref:Phosphatidylcholine 1-acylhydrolase n=1 Tax=Flavobacterium faecale TaxID=1355330 RepID=A0A2S1LE72_9FLAO|nr:phospholipase A [Flavobacterium faecale]AWG21826.1 phospholipase [Flavobacterium faecale]
MLQQYKTTLFIFLIFTFASAQIDPDKVIIRKTLSEAWELDSIDKQGTFRLMSYRPIYFSAARWSSRRNTEPFNESGEFQSKDKNIFNNIETKFQISFKTKVIQGLLFGTGDLWVGYTQKAHWQVYNKTLSRAFREVNYEPEVMLNFPTKIPLFKGHIRTVGLTLNHQSNGKDIPTSRSWNRIILNIGYEYKNWNINFRPWYRMPDDEDENPGITRSVGDAELEVATHFGKHEFYTIINHSFSTLEKGNIQLNYVFPIHGHLRGHAQVFQGYGETLIDYNIQQTTIGIGVSFANW